MESQVNSTFDDDQDDRDSKSELLQFSRSYLTNRRSVNVNVNANVSSNDSDVDVENVAIPPRCQELENILGNMVGPTFSY